MSASAKASSGIGDDIYAKAAVARRCASSIGKGVKGSIAGYADERG